MLMLQMHYHFKSICELAPVVFEFVRVLSDDVHTKYEFDQLHESIIYLGTTKIVSIVTIVAIAKRALRQEHETRDEVINARTDVPICTYHFGEHAFSNLVDAYINGTTTTIDRGHHNIWWQNTLGRASLFLFITTHIDGNRASARGRTARD